jgi:hypothetical protein
MKPAVREELDYALITHLHPDHLGDVGSENPSSARGEYKLTGLMDVEARVPIRKLIDRGFPDYSYPEPTLAPFAQNYRQYVKSRENRCELTEQVKVGSANQIRLTHRRRSTRISLFAISPPTARCGPDLASARADAFRI